MTTPSPTIGAVIPTHELLAELRLQADRLDGYGHTGDAKRTREALSLITTLESKLSLAEGALERIRDFTHNIPSVLARDTLVKMREGASDG